MEGEGVQRSILSKKHAVGVYKVQSWHIEHSGYICRKCIIHSTHGKTPFLSFWEVLGRQQLVLDCGVGDAGLRRQAQQEELVRAQLVSRESVRRQLIKFAYDRTLGPVLNTPKSYFGPDHATSDRECSPNIPEVKQPMSSNRTHNLQHYLNSDPVPYE